MTTNHRAFIKWAITAMYAVLCIVLLLLSGFAVANQNWQGFALCLTLTFATAVRGAYRFVSFPDH